MSIQQQLHRIEKDLHELTLVLHCWRKEIMLDLTALTQQVTAMKDASDAGEALIKGLAAKIDAAIQGAKDLADAKAKIAEVTATLKTEAEELGAAVAANTPAEEPPTAA